LVTEKNDLANWSPASIPRPQKLDGEHVTLEPLDSTRHAAGLWKALQGHDEVWDWLPDGPYASKAEFSLSITSKQDATNAVFLAIVSRSSGQAEGYASYMRIGPEHGVIEVGNILLAPSLQRTTAATEAMFLMARHAFEDLGYRRYEWKCNSMNEPSRRAALRLGFTFEGVFRQHMVVKGRNRDTAWFSMLDGEWPARRKAFATWLDDANFDSKGKQRLSLAQLMGCAS
jgi:RimJ/RimL family protein N-acetyltransferase